MRPRRRRNGKTVKSQPPQSNREEHQDGGRSRYSPSQVRPLTVAVVILTAVVVLSGLYLLWQLRHIVVWFVIALFLAAALDRPSTGYSGATSNVVSRSC